MDERDHARSWTGSASKSRPAVTKLSCSWLFSSSEYCAFAAPAGLAFQTPIWLFKLFLENKWNFSTAEFLYVWLNSQAKPVWKSQWLPGCQWYHLQAAADWPVMCTCLTLVNCSAGGQMKNWLWSTYSWKTSDWIDNHLTILTVCHVLAGIEMLSLQAWLIKGGIDCGLICAESNVNFMLLWNRNSS